MSNFYLKVNKNGNEIEFSTDDEKIFDEKLQDILKTFASNQLINQFVEQPINQQIEHVEQENTHSHEDVLCDFVQITQPAESLNQMQDNQENNITVEFQQILDKAQDIPTINFVEPEANNNEEFKTFVISQNPQNEMDYLIFSAQFFVKYMQKNNFTLKQINAKLVPFFNAPVTHKTLNEALERGFITLIPDCTQTSLNKEYCLTQGGEYEYKH